MVVGNGTGGGERDTTTDGQKWENSYSCCDSGRQAGKETALYIKYQFFRNQGSFSTQSQWSHLVHSVGHGLEREQTRASWIGNLW